MLGVNKVTLVGTATIEPSFKTFQNGKTVASFNLATNELYRDENGQRQERTEFHRLVVWGKQALVCRDYVHKGTNLYIEGKISSRKYTGKDGINRTVYEIVVKELQMLGSSSRSSVQGDTVPASNQSSYAQSEDYAMEATGTENFSGTDFDPQYEPPMQESFGQPAPRAGDDDAYLSF